MHKMARRATIAGASLIAAAPLFAAPAQAAPNPYSPREVCGASFVVVNDRGGIGGKAKRAISNGKQVFGHVYLLYSARTRQNCVVAIKSAYVGRRTWTSASLAIRNGRSASDQGTFTHYAGPIKLQAADKCVRYTASMRLPNGKYASGGRDAWGNCRS